MAHQIGWIDALRIWNAGNTSWCIPRKGTPAFEQVMKIRKGEKEAKSIKEIREELERKTAPSPKKEKVSVSFSIESPSEKKVKSVKTEKSSTENNVGMEQQKMAQPPDDDEMPPLEKDYMMDIEDKIEEEKKKGVFSLEHDLPWKPEDKNVISGTRRPERMLDSYKYVLGTQSVDKLDIHLLKEKVKELEAANPKDYKVEIGKELLQTIPSWKPEDEYYGKEHNYHTDTKKYTEKNPTTNVKKAVEDYQEFADQINKLRKTPIRNIYYRTVYRPDGTGGLQMYWNIRRMVKEGNKIHYQDDYKFIRNYNIAPEFKFVGGSIISKVKQEIEEEEKKEEQKETKKAEKETKKAEKEKEKVEKEKKRMEKDVGKEKEEQRKLEADLKAGKKTDRVYNHKLRMIIQEHEDDKITYAEMKQKSKALKEEFSKK